MQRLAGKTAIVTGGGGGIGGATCRRFAQEGAAVAILDLNADHAQRVADDIAAGGGRALAIACDITQRPQVDAAVAHVIENVFVIHHGSKKGIAGGLSRSSSVRRTH